MIFVDVQQTRIPAIGFGTWQLKGETCLEAVTDAIEIGYRHIDTAQAYGNESEVGQAIEQAGVPRDELFLTTKVWNTHITRDQILRSVDESLAKLKTDHVNLLLLHWPVEDQRDIEVAVRALVETLEQGQTRAIGVSNFTQAQLSRAIEFGPIICNQVECHPLFHQGELISLARKHDMMLTAYSPIAQGNDALFKSDVALKIAQSHGKSVAQVALRWLVQQDNVAAIPRSSSTTHRAANFDIFDFELSADQMQAITALDQQRRLIHPSFGPKAW